MRATRGWHAFHWWRGLSCPAEFFPVARSANANVVQEAQPASLAVMHDGEPVHASWFTLAQDGHRELERAFAYGFEARPSPDGTATPGVPRGRRDDHRPRRASSFP
ncbi:MAG TPA: hypothetical protein VMT17_10620 [Anaeromyxobacteraceae bacterium]|nr:hypothetical protein [Anaeromyxobacteraceae bacterium]